ncbi:carboxyl transferase domain-containing protein [Lachnoclostridium sp. Marseille-P6806]|uniref:carboxyl transferase domain-containing protein n=1 Tax=Lachnoclostridium sp. Marseille-P6806 TaxID=2364793 RepID=UPI0010327178|nr:carboxyl transferase domain-containing protein [Lachnoclostridium sp. Marseille-P6806]
MSSSSKAGIRITSLLDENSFVEIGARVTARTTDFNQKPEQAPSDGVITGYGVIDGSLVYVYGQDASVLGGSVGEMHAKKIANLYDLAMRTGAPVIGLIDSAGIRLQESTDALNAIGSIYAKQAAASGVIPQITAVFGSCGGGLSLFPALTDFSFMADDAKLFVNAPNTLAGNVESKNDTASAKAKAACGSVDVTGTEEEVIAAIRELVSFLPSNNDEIAFNDCEDDLNRASENVAAGRKDPSVAVADVADDGVFFEVKKAFAPEMAIGFIRLNGTTVGVVANRSASFDENGKEAETYEAVLTPGGCYKAERFVSFCDAFNIPVVSFTNVQGFKACERAETKIADAAAKLAFAFADADVAKVNVILGSAVGSAVNVMNSKALGADLTIALPDAKIGIMDAKLAAQIIADGKSAEEIAETAKKFDALQNSIESAAARGYVDEIVEPADLRKYLIGAIEMLYTKQTVVEKKHGTV